mgnify:CR=1 FL=1
MDSKNDLNVWDIIDTYFRDTSYYKTQHQIDSFDEFLLSQNGIQNIIKRENPFIIFKGENRDKTSFMYEIRIHFGETLDPDGTIIPDTDNIFVSSPGIYNNNKLTYLFPNEARLKNLTYGTTIFCNIGVEFISLEDNTKTITNFEKVNIGDIPIMIHSQKCLLRDLDDVKLSEFGECPYDQGGYFIIRGKEKVMLSFEKKVNNVLYINKTPEDKIILQGNIKSVSNEGFQSSRTNNVSLVRNTIRQTLGDAEIKRYENTFMVRILGFDSLIPAFILFRALGFETDKQIISLIIYETDIDSLKSKLIEELLPSVKDSQPIFSQKSAYKFLSLQTKGKENFNVYDTLTNNLFPNYGSNETEKGYYLGYVIRQILLTHCNLLKETNRDSYVNKRVDLPGSLLLELYRELWGGYKKQISRKLDDEYKLNYESSAKTDISDIINTSNYSKIFDNSVMQTIEKSFGARFGTNISARQGIVQSLNRNVMLGTLSHVRRIAYQLPPGSKTIGPRKLNNTQWGMICPTESPDGGNVGIMNHLSFISRVTTTISESEIIMALEDADTILLSSVVSSDFHTASKVFVNGKIIGVHLQPKLLVRHMKLLKLNSLINITISISWDIQKNEIHIFSDSGRIIRPIFHIKKQKDGTQFNQLLNKDYSYIRSWKHAIHGYMIMNDSVDFNTEFYFRDELQNIKESYPDDYLDFLESKSAPIEYIDSIETENTFIAKDMYNIESFHTHCEIHSSLILSAVSLNIPFPEHSQFPRNVFSCQQTKQAVGVYTSAFNNRFETFSHILYYPQRPIVTTRYKKYTDVDKLPYGINAIVAIASYSGYNQEDGILINQSSIDRGMFTSLYLRSYEESEELKQNGQKVYFANPSFEKNTPAKVNEKEFSKLDDNGFIKENVYITHDDVIMSKCSQTVKKNGQIKTNVKGETINYGTSGIVDKVVVFKNKENLRTCKVRVRKEKKPTVGDKFSSRCGQKGMCGMVLPQWEMPFTKDGIVPDIIINPHAIPSRMTINQLLEVILGKTACISGHLGDATPFQNNDINEFSKVLHGFNYEKNGNEVMYSGITGDQIKTSIFIGPTYYQRLKIMVADKMFSRSTGPLQHLVRQPAHGRANKGGLRIGEMERDSIIGHGISSFLQESMMKRSDAFKVQIDTKDGLITYDNHPETKKMVHLPYTMKLLLQELQTMSVAPRLITENHIANKPVFNYLYQNIHNQSLTIDTPDIQSDSDESE